MSVAVDLVTVPVTHEIGSEIRPEDLEPYRRELTGYCYRMLGSGFEADDAVQETMVRAWKAIDSFEGRSSVRSWLYRIATNVCLDMLRGRQRRAAAMDLGPAGTADAFRGATRPENAWVEPDPRRPGRPRRRRPGRGGRGPGDDPPGLRHRPAAPPGPPAGGAHPARGAALAGDRGGRAARHHAWRRSTAPCSGPGPRWPTLDLDDAEPTRLADADQQELLARYVDAFERYDITSLVALLHDDVDHVDAAATTSGSPGPVEMGKWFLGQGTAAAARAWWPPRPTAAPRSASYRPDPNGGHAPWSIQVLRDVRRPDRRPPQLPRHRPVRRVRPAFAPRQLGHRARRTGHLSRKPGRRGSSSSSSSGQASRTRIGTPRRRAASCMRARASTIDRSGRPVPASGQLASSA